MNEGVAGAALIGVSSSVSVFNSLLPPFSEVRKSVGELDMVNDVRMGEIASFALVVGIGVTATMLTKSPIPAIVSVVSAVALVMMYEAALQTTPREMKEN